MKKITLLSMLLFSIIVKVQAQYSSPPNYAPVDKYIVLDSANLKCTYKLTYIKDTLVKTRISTDIQTLQIGPAISKYFSQYAYDYNVKSQLLVKNGAQAIPMPKQYGACSYEVFKNYPKGKFTITDLGSGRIGKNIYEESDPKLQWDIKMDFDSVLSYRCQKAITKFRGRIYEAWFTTEIPIGNGPWKLGGLPGLILKVSDLQHHYTFECIGIETLKNKEPIKLFQLNYTHYERKDLYKLYSRFHKDPIGYAKSIGTEEHIMINGVEAKQGEFKYPFNPIEIE